MSAVFRSGTNQFHGDVEDRYTNKDLMHRNYFDVGKFTQPFAYHELTSVAAGPVRIPKIYNGRDKTFFLFGFIRHNEVGGESVLRDVPSPEMLAGDFSFGGRGQTIYDPASTTLQGTTSVSSATFCPVIRFRLTALIPWRRISSATIRLPSRTPPASSTPAARMRTSRMGLNTKSYRTRYDIKLDHQFNSNHKIFGRYSQARHRAYSDRWALEIDWRLIDPNTVPIPIDQENIVVSDIYTISPTSINEVRVGMNRRRQTRVPESLNQGWAKQLGIPNVGDGTFPGLRPTPWSSTFDQDLLR